MQTDGSSKDTKVCNRCGVEKQVSEFYGDTAQPPCKACRAVWYTEHRLEVIAAQHNAKARRLGVIGTLTADDLADVLAEQGAACLVCKTTERLHFDHVVSFFCRGDNLPENLQILCIHHNSAKGRMCLDYRN